MHKSLQIVEIIQVIFQYTDRDTDAVCTQICKTWHETALDALWHHIERLDPLLSILSPMAEVFGGVMTFPDTNISASRWQRFISYAKRVRRIDYIAFQGPAIHIQSFAAVAIGRPVLHLFPNLVHLTWNKDPAKPSQALPLSLLFIHPGLRRLEVYTGTHATQQALLAVENFLEEVALRAPQLERFDFQTNIPYRRLGPRFANALSSFQRLKVITLSDSLLTSDVLTALGSCPELEAIRRPEFSWQDEPESHDDLENFSPEMEDTSFPSIDTIALTAHLWHIARFLQSDFPASRLRALHVKSLEMETIPLLHHFFDVLSAECPLIEKLTVFIPPGDHGFVPDEEPYSIPFQTLAPLLECEKLLVLEISSRLPIELDDSHAIQMAQSWPALQVLSFSVDIFSYFHSPDIDHLSLYGTIPFAENCPNLQKLSLPFDVDRIPSVDERKTFGTALRKFQLSVTSPDFSAEELALFLTDVTPPNCIIEGPDVRPEISFMIQGWRGHATAAFRDAEAKDTRLGEALAMLPVLRKVHARYRSRICSLEDQVSRLTAHS
ncbi:hypothetical protein HGRIS_010946 [Hohenbuehelia grisea]|uniref:F-box domain-containing protein n=1 Tax=Hohenbuehelia grisea TaxID=104357 RepID=A0ABR3IYB6_9AGAR